MLSSYSHNSLNTFDDCPRRFKFTYIEKVEVPERVTADLYLGNAVHRALARVYELALNGVTISLDDLLAFYRAEWEKPERNQIIVIKDFMGVDDYIRIGEDMIATYYKKYTPFTEGRAIGIELDLRAPLPDSHYVIRGRVDRLTRRPDGIVEIVDYKTGSVLPRGGKDPKFYDQMGLYYLLVRENYPDLEPVELVQYYLKLNETIRLQVTDDDRDLIVERIRGVIRAALVAERLDNFPAQEGRSCDYCPFFKLCPAKRHRLILQNEAGELDQKEKATSETAAALAERYVDLDGRKKELEGELDALREDLITTARDLQVSKLAAKGATITISLNHEEKLPTKSTDMEAFIEISGLVRQWELEEALTVDIHALEKLIEKEQLSPERIAKLREYLVAKESSRISVRRPKKQQDTE
jgi:putative RecB family exonuclease